MRTRLLWLGAILLAGCGAHHDGWEVGSGGGRCKSAWVDAVNETRAIIVEGRHPLIALTDLDAAIARTEIVYRTRVTLGPNEVDAVNFPDATPPRIEIGCERFEALTVSDRTELAAHELASILRLDDSRKQISGALDIARVCRRKPAVRTAIENATGKVCNVVRPSELARVSELRLRLKRLEGLDATDFAGMAGLRRLDLSYNALKDLPPGIFGGLPRLSFLDLRGNDMTAISTGLFAGAALDEVSGYSMRDASAYWDNPIERIERGFLGPNSQATSVMLCPRVDAFVREIADGAFEGLREGAQVSLCVSFGGPVRREAFRELEKAAKLQLVGSGFHYFPVGFFSTVNAQAIDFSGDGPLPPSIIGEIDGNSNVAVVRFYRQSQAKELTQFKCRPLVPNGREPGFVKMKNPQFCFRRS